jgi:hypothetical protein
MKQGDKLICLEEVKSRFGDKLFEKGKTYIVLYVDNESKATQTVCLNHKLFSNEYQDFPLEWILQKFKPA